MSDMSESENVVRTSGSQSSSGRVTVPQKLFHAIDQEASEILELMDKAEAIHKEIRFILPGELTMGTRGAISNNSRVLFGFGDSAEWQQREAEKLIGALLAYWTLAEKMITAKNLWKQD
jgi:hypothetical protein